MSELTHGSTRGGTPEKTFFHPNPVLKRISRDVVRSDSNAATYNGIAVKTCFFLLATLAGMVAYLLVFKPMLAREAVWQTLTIGKNFTCAVSKKEVIYLAVVLVGGFILELVGIFARKTVPVTGTLYSACQGYFISFLVFKVLGDNNLSYLGLQALLITVAVVAVMSWLYTSGKVRVDRRFSTVLMTLILASMGVGLLTFLGSFIPGVRDVVGAVRSNIWVVIGLDVLGIVLASLFLISDFSMIDNVVKERADKSYEWSAAFGLVFTVIWLYLKILDLLIQLKSQSDK